MMKEERFKFPMNMRKDLGQSYSNFSLFPFSLLSCQPKQHGGEFVWNSRLTGLRSSISKLPNQDLHVLLRYLVICWSPDIATKWG
ncbi:hypothetical protein L6164_007518 [Bauhinia variegata]|uniref:Uncharacterized protein n=1 Tax=Bauhinia variegata TaxID=167791 RepID=A0ACB9PDW2_BAUVA|nr:hypothetical protein L6164_007518 [Bauhinia variegata]